MPVRAIERAGEWPAERRTGAKWQGASVWLVLMAALLSSSCFGLFDFGIEWQDGRYALIWVNSYGTMALGYEDDAVSGASNSYGTLVDPEVFSVGSDAHYVVAAQHPDGNKSVTLYFILDKSQQPHLKDVGVLGPLTDEEFAAKRAELNLPTFSKTIEILR